MIIEHHPRLDGVLCRDDGMIFVPANGARKAHWTKGCLVASGYLVIRIRGKTYLAHRLIAETFIHNPENKAEVDHIDRNRCNNAVKNLRWATRSENQRNTPRSDRVDARGGTHKYDDKNQYRREYQKGWYRKHKETTK